MRRENELPDDLQAEFEKYRQAYSDREDSGLLTGEAAISVIYRKNDSRFRIQWSPDGSLEPIEQEDAAGAWRRAEGDIRQRFPVRIYSQKHVFQMAKTPLALLSVVDEASEIDRHAWAEKWKEKENRFLSLRAKAREIEAGLAEEPRLRGELDDVKRKPAVFEQAGHADVLKAFQKRSRQQQDVEAWEESWNGVGKKLLRTAAEIVPDTLEEMSFDSHSTADNALRGHAAEARERLDAIREAIGSLAAQADDIFKQWQSSKDKSSWKQSVDAAAQAYEELKQRLEREGAGDPAAYGGLVQRRQNIERRLKELDERKKQVDALKDQADAQLRLLMETRRKLTENREKFLDNVLKKNQYVRIRVAPYGAREIVESEFRRLLQKEDGSFEKDIGSPGEQGLLGELYGADTVDIERNLANIKEKIRQIALNRHDPETIADRRFATHIGKLPPEAGDRLDLWFPQDSLDVQYSPTGDGRSFRSIQEGSPGQKTAALPAFLLSYGKEPLILDQPEDDLDNRLIYDLIVNQLREVKRRRQIIVVTHNANIVVNGDAELVTALDARGGETQKECAGSLQEKQVRAAVCSVMEGGRKAFDDRYRRITFEGRHA